MGAKGLLMRWGSSASFGIGAALLLLLLNAPLAAAYPSVTLTPEFSSGVLGSPGSVNAIVKVEGTEYGGFPPPVLGITLTLPAGSTVGATDHATCSKAVLEQTGPSGCPASSAAGPVGSAHSIVSFGAERVEESELLETYYAPGGGLNFFIDGHSPVSMEILASGTISGNVITMDVPLVSTVPAAPYASLTELWVRLGETEEEEEDSQFTSGVALPFECPAGTFSWSAAATFDEGGAVPFQPHTTEAGAKTDCPLALEASRSKRAAEALARRHGEEEAAAKKRSEEEAAANKRHADEAELTALRALVATLRTELHAGVKIRRMKVTSHGVVVVIETSEPGVVTITGAGVHKLTRSLPAGTHTVTLSLTARGRVRRRRHQATALSVSDKVGARTVATGEKLRL